MAFAMLPIILFLTYRYSFYNPTKMVIFYLILSTYTFGFFNPADIVIGGIELGMFSVNMILFVSIFFYKDWYEIDKWIAPMFLVITSLLLYGIFAPSIREHESIKQGFTSSKFFLYYALFFYMFIRRKEVDVYAVIKFMKYIAIYFTVIAIIFLAGGSIIIPPGYTQGYGTGGDGALFLQHPTYISLGLFIYYAEWQMKKITTKKFLIVFITFYIALFVCGFSALIAFSFASLSFIYTIWHGGGTRESYLSIKKIITVLLVVVTTYVASVKLQDIIAEQYHAISTGEDLALRTRELYNRFRWDAINDHPLFGMGFIHKSAPIMKIYATYDNPYMEKFDVIDSGYVDLLVRFGYIGTTVYLSLVGVYLLSIFRYENPPPYALAAAGYLLPYFLMNKTWSVFSFHHGIIPLCVAFYIIYNFRPSKPYYKVYN